MTAFKRSADHGAGDRRLHRCDRLRRVGSEPIGNPDSSTVCSAAASASRHRPRRPKASQAQGQAPRAAGAGTQQRTDGAARAPRRPDPAAHRRDRAIAAPQSAARSAASATCAAVPTRVRRRGGRASAPRLVRRCRRRSAPRPPPRPGRRGDAFDPAQNPNAPGAPRVLGSTGVRQCAACAAGRPSPSERSARPAGARRRAARPFDAVRCGGPRSLACHARPDGIRRSGLTGPRAQSERGRRAGRDAAALRQPEGQLRPRLRLRPAQGLRARRRRLPQLPEADSRTTGWRPTRNTGWARACSSASATATPRNPSSTSRPSTKPTGKAPDALLRLGQSLAALGEKEAACASLGEVLRKYPRASVGVKQGVDREQKRVRC